MSPSPPPRGRKAKHCSHSPPHGRGGNGKSGGVSRGASPVANFDSSFSPRSISPEIKGKTELVVCFGELLIDFVPTVGGLSLADAPAFKKAPGGAPANVAVGIAKLGGNAAFVGKASIMHYGSISLITEPSRSTHMEAMRIAREGGCMLSYDPNLRLPLWPSPEAAKDGIKSIWDQADIIKVSDEEVVFLTGGDPKSDDNNMRMFHPRCKLMLVTEGGEGCRYYTQKFKGKVGGIKVQVVDTTGAGDAFCAGLLSNLAKDFGIIDVSTWFLTEVAP
ncbi:hypothetical protein M758_2G066700 [Ceratodon purpureus]|nr:hypothetical protein M758_2G066700 [Ceratodon purpureus]